MEESEVGSDCGAKNSGPLNALIDALSFELHAPGYNFLGPGTNVAGRLERGQVGINPLDELARQYDLAYSNENADRAFSRNMVDT